MILKVIYVVGLIAISYSAFIFQGGWRIALVTFGVIWLFFGLNAIKQLKKIESLPLLADSAVVISKLSKQNISGMGAITTTTHTYTITFELSEGIRKKFTVNASQYELIAEGDSGILEYKEHLSYLEFVDFKRDI